MPKTSIRMKLSDLPHPSPLRTNEGAHSHLRGHSSMGIEFALRHSVSHAEPLSVIKSPLRQPQRLSPSISSNSCAQIHRRSSPGSLLCMRPAPVQSWIHNGGIDVISNYNSSAQLVH